MKRYLISGGGTGGHIFPAVSIANALKRKQPDCEILFVGAEGRMEMERVPAAGYKIVGLPIAGFDRQRLWRNVAVAWKLMKSLYKARKVVKDFKPDVAVGVGGYASGAALKAANNAGVPTLLQEQNSFAGVTNKLLAKKAQKICVAYEGMERFFPADKIMLTGNPIRQDLLKIQPKATEAYSFFNFSPEKKTLLIIGGSLGARTINQSIAAGLDKLKDAGIQVIWQTGKNYYSQAKQEATMAQNDHLLATDFISRMDYAYAIADVVISRAGASSISELCLLKKPSILVPSPNVAEDHQTHNAMALVNKGAAILVKDADAVAQLVDVALKVMNDEQQLSVLAQNIALLAQHDSADRIADEVIALAE
ncbi:MAG: undecaprenyldiphospho-muramoylpentapeptide beta-N-acetylglucosaminyltransferase [Paludibacteraceae bacterium]|nr:undecaprenyldiphospho-muramoylpentapeptide beta-N-acetylglucosaminyltransferase [Paludibacteraceae bacterium]